MHTFRSFVRVSILCILLLTLLLHNNLMETKLYSEVLYERREEALCIINPSESMELSSPKERVLSSSDCMSDPEEEEEHEISEDEDDDRNHKHRRKEEETRSQSQSLEQGSSDHQARPYRKNYRHSGNGEHEKRSMGGGGSSAQRVQFDNQRARSNPMFSRDSGHGRGGRGNYGSWAPQRDSRFNPVDLSSHMVPNMFGGRGLGGVPAAQSAPWPAFGMINGVPNGGLDAFHHMQGPLRPPLNASLNMGIARQRCRDFEERGFCLRGDMCPMEHGINRIVVDDVQVCFLELNFFSCPWIFIWEKHSNNYRFC